jgi:uncharacterized integral membrane protein (TIGR00698 family)
MTTAVQRLISLGPGLLLVGTLSSLATWVAGLPAMQALSISPLIIGILLGAILGNSVRGMIPDSCGSGVVFSAKMILRLAIILYGFRITFGQIVDVGIAGFVLDVLMVTSTLCIGTVVGTRIFGMDKDMAIMTSAGAAICGAAAVVATEPVVKAEAHKTAIAIATVVLFGTVSMFLYPIVYRAGLVSMSEQLFGVYIGASVHEVAHVVGAGGAISDLAMNTAVIVKMTRVMLLAPALLFIGWFLSRAQSESQTEITKLVIPWFAVGFIAVAGFNSFGLLPETLLVAINTFDTFLLTMAMTALGLETNVSKFRGVGLTPIFLAFVLFAWLVFGGYIFTLLLLV